MDKQQEQLVDTLEQIMKGYECENILSNEDEMTVWKVKMEWLIKQLVDIKVGALYDYALKNRVVK